MLHLINAKFNYRYSWKCNNVYIYTATEQKWYKRKICSVTSASVTIIQFVHGPIIYREEDKNDPWR